MIDPDHFRRHVIRPALADIGLDQPAAEALLLGTALVESGLMWLVQHDGGPARGLYQVEPATHADVYENYLDFAPRAELKKRVTDLLAPRPRPLDQLVTNLAYATAIARLVYWRVKEPLPDPLDAYAMGAYWKRHYNTRLGAGAVEDFVGFYDRQVLVVP